MDIIWFLVALVSSTKCTSPILRRMLGEANPILDSSYWTHSKDVISLVLLMKLQEALIHASNKLAVRGLKDEEKHPDFIKSCMAFNEVTIPAVSNTLKQLNLYIETAEVWYTFHFYSHSQPSKLSMGWLYVNLAGCNARRFNFTFGWINTVSN